MTSGNAPPRLPHREPERAIGQDRRPEALVQRRRYSRSAHIRKGFQQIPIHLDSSNNPGADL